MTTLHHPLAGERLISRTELRRFVPISDMGLWRWIRAGKFPMPVYVGPRRFWTETSITRWLAERSTCAGSQNRPGLARTLPENIAASGGGTSTT
jgi:predicted DNA-binding transcriptional regulator AlpA